MNAPGSDRLARLSLALLLLGAGCGSSANVDAIKKFGTLADQAQQTSDAMATSLYADCLTTREYAGLTAVGATQGEALSSDPLAGAVPPPPGPGAPPVPKPVYVPPAHDVTCDVDLATSRRWKAFNDGIFAYVQGLGAVAGVSVAPSQAKFRAVGEGLVKLGAVQNNSIADAAGDFVAAIGNAVIQHQKDRDLRDLIARSHEDNIFQQLIAASLLADRAYYGAVFDDMHVVGEYFRTIIIQEDLETDRLLLADGDIANKPTITEPEIDAATLRALDHKCSVACDRHIRLLAQIVVMRDRIATQRERWSQIDAQMLTDLNRTQPFYTTMTDLGQANDALINTPKPGLAGYAVALKPYIDDLDGSVESLVAAVATPPTSAAAGSAKKGTQ